MNDENGSAVRRGKAPTHAWYNMGSLGDVLLREGNHSQQAPDCAAHLFTTSKVGKFHMDKGLVLQALRERRMGSDD